MSNVKPVYVLMCAGSSSRFNRGLSDEQREHFKQAIVEKAGAKEVIKCLLPIGPNNEALIEYNMRMFQQAGGEEVVLVVRPDTERNFRELYGNEFHGLSIGYAHQTIPEYRKKPKGTLDALVSAAAIVGDRPIIGSNGDDVYGPAFETLFANQPRHDYDITTLGYMLAKVIPRTDESYTMAVLQTEGEELIDCTEYHEIVWSAEHTLFDHRTETVLKPEYGASMNIVYVAPGAYQHMIAANMVQQFRDPEALEKMWGKDEFLIPNFLSIVPGMELTSCRVIPFDQPRPPGVTWATDIDKIKAQVLTDYHGNDPGKQLWAP